MKREIGEKWIAALESGEYMKGTGKLCLVTSPGHTTFCCMGVLAELAIADGEEVEKIWWNDTFAEYQGERAFLPPVVRDWAGLKTTNGKYKDENDHVYSLVELNDETDGFGSVIEIIREKTEEL